MPLLDTQKSDKPLRDEGRTLIAGYKSRRPVQTLAAAMSAQKRICTKLKKMAPVLEPKFADNGLEAIKILQSHTGSPFLAVRKITCGVGFHNIESTK
jgi:hypothetical protein